MFGASCARNCGAWKDCGGVMGKCTDMNSPYHNQPTRHDFSCPAHPMIVRMMGNTVVGEMNRMEGS